MDIKHELTSEYIEERNESDIEIGDTFLLKDTNREERMIKSNKARTHRRELRERLSDDHNRGYKGNVNK